MLLFVRPWARLRLPPRRWSALLAALGLGALGAALPAAADTFAIGDGDFLLNGKPYVIRCGEMHFARIPREYWAQRLRMARAMGLNTVCAYLFWNLHEPQPGHFDFRGEADAAAFCRVAQAEGLKVILRPGPYSCAEWDFGGFPYWLLKTPDLKLRTRDPRYLAACQRYLTAVGRQLAPLQVTHGGPILMVQVENEYGSYGGDREYLGLLREYLKGAGFDVPFFTCDGPSQLPRDTRADLFCVVNFGSDPAANFQALRKVRPTGPLMCGEYYPGWFDSWGQAHHFGDSGRITREIGWMLEHRASFSIYMVHGGTSFGFTAGANCPPFAPETTSYDYDAPISEAGWDTPKYHALRELFRNHLGAGETLPAVPARLPVIAVPPIALADSAGLLANLPRGIAAARPRCMELYDQAHGCILYRTQLPATTDARLAFHELHDYARVFVDGKLVATLDRRHNENAAALPATGAGSRLDVLVEAMGHVNYGHQMFDRKGITDGVDLVAAGATNALTGWQVFKLPLDHAELEHLRFGPQPTTAPAFYRATFHLDHVGDTFLDFRTWGKGVAWVNGHNLGRFWRIGPHQTLYCPAPWLKVGRNQLVVFDLVGPERAVVAGLTEPILNEVRP